MGLRSNLAKLAGVVLASSASQLCNAAPAAPPVSLLSITLGAPFSIARCGAKPVPGETCAEETLTIDYGPGSIRRFELHTPSVDRPDYVKFPGGIILSVIDDNVEGITLITTGTDMQEVALQQLTEKFGKPGSLQPKTVQNGFGAKFSYVEASWNIGATQVHFEGLSGDIRSGEIAATTAKLRRQLIDQYRKSQEAGPHL